MRTRLKRLLFRLLGKDPEAVIVCFRSGEDALADAMCAEIRRLEPNRRLFEVRLEDLQRKALRGLGRKFRGFRIGLAPVLFTADPRYRPLRRVAFFLAPFKILAYNARLERHHLSRRQPIASWLFWRGVPLDRIFLRPRWLVPWKKDRTIRPSGHRTIEGRAPREGRARVAVLSPYFPYPLSHGGAVRIYHLLREIAHEFDIVLYSFTESEIADGDLKPVLALVARAYLVKKPRYREPRWSTSLPPEVCEYQSPEMRTLWNAREAEASQVEYTQLAPYGGDILVEHDVTWDLHAQVLSRKRTLGARWDWKRWKRFEDAAIRRFRAVITMSEKDRKLLGISHALVIENGVDLDRFEPSPETPGRRLLFIGSFRHFPNVQAFRFLIEEILPLVADAELTVVAGPDPWPHWGNLTGLLRPPENPRLKILEYVADVVPLYRETNLVLVTTLESAGTNVKVLEALAMERAVVSTTTGCAGLGLEHGKTAWIADSARAIAEGITELLSDAALRTAIAKAGREHARKHFDWRAIGRKQRELLREITGDQLVLRPGTAQDLEAITRIQAASKGAAQWPPESYLAMQCTVAVAADRACGFVVSRETSPGEREILNIAVEPAARRKGMARRLLENELNRDEATWFLEVRESNAAAIALYRSIGFRPVGVRKEYYNDTRESGIVMKLLS